MTEFQADIKKYPIYFTSSNKNLKFSDKVLYQTLFVLNTYIDNFDEYLVNLAENEIDNSLVLYQEEFFDIFDKFINNIAAYFTINIATPYIAKYPENKFHEILEFEDDILLELDSIPICSDEEIGMRILDLIIEFYEITQEIKKLTRESNFDLIKDQCSDTIPDVFFTMFTTTKISSFTYIKTSLRIFAQAKFIEEAKDKKKRS